MLRYLGDNKLGPLSILRMRDSMWDSLAHLLLGTFVFIKVAMALETGDANTFRGQASLK